jgi:hypothetical protein
MAPHSRRLKYQTNGTNDARERIIHRRRRRRVRLGRIFEARNKKKQKEKNGKRAEIELRP